MTGLTRHLDRDSRRDTTKNNGKVRPGGIGVSYFVHAITPGQTLSRRESRRYSLIPAGFPPGLTFFRRESRRNWPIPAGFGYSAGTALSRRVLDIGARWAGIPSSSASGRDEICTAGMKSVPPG